MIIFSDNAIGKSHFCEKKISSPGRFPRARPRLTSSESSELVGAPLIGGPLTRLQKSAGFAAKALHAFGRRFMLAPTFRVLAPQAPRARMRRAGKREAFFLEFSACNRFEITKCYRNGDEPKSLRSMDRAHRHPAIRNRSDIQTHAVRDQPLLPA